MCSRIQVEFARFRHFGMARFLIASLTLFASMSASADITLKFGIYTSETSTLLVAQFRPLLNQIEQKMSGDLKEAIHIEMRVSSDYDECIQSLAQGKVDFARLGPASYIIARKLSPNIKILALEKEKDGKIFHGVILTRKDSGINKLADLKGKRFAFGDPNSTAGRYLSQYALLKAGITASDLSSYQYLGRHDRVAAAVWQDDFDAGAVKEDVYLRMKEQGLDVKSLARMRNVTGPWAARAGLTPSMIASLRNALLELPESVVEASIQKLGFLPYKNGDLNLVRKAVEENSLFFYKARS